MMLEAPVVANATIVIIVDSKVTAPWYSSRKLMASNHSGI